jgi:hypothetical protein
MKGLEKAWDSLLEILKGYCFWWDPGLVRLCDLVFLMASVKVLEIL